MTNSPIATLLMRIEEYKRKFYLNRLIKGVIFSLALILSAFLIFNTLEYFGHFGTAFRAFLFFSFLIALCLSLFFWVIKPAIFLYGKQKPLSTDQAADQIGKLLPEVGDKLINTLQLSKKLDAGQNELLLASIKQKSQNLGFVKFADAINVNENRKYIKYAAIPFALILGILALSPSFFSKSSERIVNFKNEYQEEAPFKFELKNKELKAFKNEDFTINLALLGNAIPEDVFINENGRKLKMDKDNKGNYSYTFSKVQDEFEFNFEAAGFKSGNYEIEIIKRPTLGFFDVNITYPAYLKKPNESLKNVGNLNVPEGTVIEWDYNVTDTDSIIMTFEGEKQRFQCDKKLLGGGFTFTKKMKTTAAYQVYLRNKYANTKDGINYFINVIPDQHPSLTLENYKDSTLYNFMILGGNISDDYGISKLAVFYRILRDGKPNNGAYASIPLPSNPNQTIQSFYYQWNLSNLKLNPADKIEYFVQVWDNDGVNGPKATRSVALNYAIPDKRSINNEIDKSIDKTEEQIQKTLEKAQKLKKDIAALETRLKNKKELDFQDKKLAEELLKKKEELNNEIKALQEQNKALNEKQQHFDQQKPEIQQKMEALQKMMQELINKDTDKSYEELKKNLEQNNDEKLLEMMEKLKNKEKTTEKELERMKELFKKLQLDQKLEKTIKDLNEQADKQQKLAEKNEALDKKANSEEKKQANEELKKEQDKLNKEFEDSKKDLKEAEKLNEEMKSKSELDTQKEDQNDISKDQKDAKEAQESGKNKAAAEKQKRAVKNLRKMAESLSKMKADKEKEQAEEDIDALRDILENLVSLSFDQERLMKDFKGINQSDPRFVKLSQDQIKLQDDAKVVEDSLYTLSRRVMQIESFVTREMTNMKGYMGDAVKSIKERKLGQTGVKQQFAMSSMNNLALLLSDVLKQMQEAEMKMGDGKGKKKGKKPSKGLGEMQKKLNEQMQKMGEGSKGGKLGTSEELAKMAQQQAQIRRMLQKMAEEKEGTEAGKKLGDQIKDLTKKMEETETDLVNKRVSQQTIKRQQEIMTRLLESEKALKEQEEDDKRKAETARQNISRSIPPAFEQYIKNKQKQTELLRTVPPNLNPYYKRQVDIYFKKIQ